MYLRVRGSEGFCVLIGTLCTAASRGRLVNVIDGICNNAASASNTHAYKSPSPHTHAPPSRARAAIIANDRP